MRVTWVHPSWRDLVIEHLSNDDGARERFLRGSSIHGTLLALSVSGGATGARRLPLLNHDRDWDALSDRVYELAPDLEQAELIGLLVGIAHTIEDLEGISAEAEVQALARALLTRVSGLWKAAGTPISLPELEAWLALAELLTQRPAPPSIAVTWAELLPASAPDVSDQRSIERFADWLTLSDLLFDYDTEILHQLGFPGHSHRFIDAFLNMLARHEAGLRISGDDQPFQALARIPKLFPTLADRAQRTLSWLEEHSAEGPPEDPPPWPSTNPDPGHHTSGQLDVQRVLKDL